jgi:hypothetical protein
MSMWQPRQNVGGSKRSKPIFATREFSCAHKRSMKLHTTEEPVVVAHAVVVLLDLHLCHIRALTVSPESTSSVRLI